MHRYRYSSVETGHNTRFSLYFTDDEACIDNQMRKQIKLVVGWGSEHVRRVDGKYVLVPAGKYSILVYSAMCTSAAHHPFGRQLLPLW